MMSTCDCLINSFAYIFILQAIREEINKELRVETDDEVEKKLLLKGTYIVVEHSNVHLLSNLQQMFCFTYVTFLTMTITYDFSN